jgi:UDP-glucose:glycoprotein glucosyltransferase
VSGEPAACEALILERAGAGLSDTMQRVLRLALASRKYSPRVELFRSLAPAAAAPPGACCWVHVPGPEVGGRALTAASELPAALDAAAAHLASVGAADVGDTLTLHPMDHVHPASYAAAPAAILYAAPGAACFPELHAALSAAAASGAARYALRPVPPSADCAAPGCAAARAGMGAASSTDPPGPLMLGGFGVEMALKNMEYKAIDDSNKARMHMHAKPNREDPLAAIACVGRRALTLLLASLTRCRMRRARMAVTTAALVPAICLTRMRTFVASCSASWPRAGLS